LTGVLKAALANLHPDQRDVIEKAYLGEVSHQQISDLTGSRSERSNRVSAWACSG